MQDDILLTIKSDEPNWEDVIDEFNHIFNKHKFFTKTPLAKVYKAKGIVNPKKLIVDWDSEYDKFVINSDRCSWQCGSAGVSITDVTDNTKEIMEKAFTCFGYEYTAKIYNIAKHLMEYSVSTHDIPCGNYTAFKVMRECRYCRKLFDHKHRGHYYCSKACQKVGYKEGIDIYGNAIYT